MEGYRAWTIWACPDCGRDRGPIPQYVYRSCECGSHRPQREVEVVPASQLEGAVEENAELQREVARLRGQIAAATAEGYADGLHDGRHERGGRCDDSAAPPRKDQT